MYSLAFNAVTLVVAILALVVSSRISLRQAKFMRDASHVEVALEFFREFRTPEFLASLDYVRTRLHTNDPALGLLNLPEESKAHALKVGYFFQSLGFLVKFRVTDADLWITCMGRQITTAWEAIAPYAMTERKRGVLGVASLHFFEHLAACCADVSHAERLRRVGLRRYVPPPASEKARPAMVAARGR
jgi:hypothetical protein